MTCSVSLFHEGYAAIQDIPIATCATAVDLTDGTTVILIVNEALYFGDSMDHSLINPNQIWVTGIPVNSDPFNQTQPFGIDHPETFIPFATEGTTIYLTSRTPTNEELDHFQFWQIELTDDDEWKPESVDLSQGLDRKISMVNWMRQFVTNCESDEMLMRVSEALTLNTQSIQAMDRGAKGVVLESRHHAITPEWLAGMWGIGIEGNAKCDNAERDKTSNTSIAPSISNRSS
jgi:hypothetical protein